MTQAQAYVFTHSQYRDVSVFIRQSVFRSIQITGDLALGDKNLNLA